MATGNHYLTASFPRDLTAGLVIFLVALPLCLGIALASGASPLSGLIAGVVGGIIVGFLSGSHTSVSGPAAGLTTIVAAQIATLGFDLFLFAVVLAGLFQIVLGLARAGFLAAFFPTSVIKGLLAAIGVILILKQIPHVLGHDTDPEGEMSFLQTDHESTFTELFRMLSDIQLGSAFIGVLSVVILFAWDKYKPLKKTVIPPAVIVVMLGIGLSFLFRKIGAPWMIESSHLVDVPVAESFEGLVAFLRMPDFSQWNNSKVYLAALTIAAVASLETLLNLEAVDSLDPRQRVSPPSRELVAQGVGNMISGMIGGLPITSVIARSSVNINAGGKTKVAAILQGLLLLVSVVFLPIWLNQIPISCLAAILLMTGIKLASPALIKQMWKEGPFQFIPFIATVIAIVFTDLLVGVLIGLGVSISFILWSNARRPIRLIVEKHLGGEVVHIELANQVSFLNRASLQRAFNEVPRGGHVLLDARNTDYIDPDVLDMIRDFKEQAAPVHGVEVSLIGFRKQYQIEDQIQYVDYSTRELQSAVTPQQVLQILKEGHQRFRSGHRLTRDLGRQVNATASGQHPLAVVLSCIDSRSPTELIFDLGVGDIFSVRIAGNVSSRNVIGSVEYACAVVGAKLVMVMGHSRCGAVTTAVNLMNSHEATEKATGCTHLDQIIRDIQLSVEPQACAGIDQMAPTERESIINAVARRNVMHTVDVILQESQALSKLVQEGRIMIVGSMYDVVNGNLEFL